MKKKKINSKTGDLFYSLWKKLNDIQFINSVNLIKKRLKINNFEEKRFKNKVILDVGCGSGRFCILANQLKAKKVFGIDSSIKRKDIFHTLSNYDLFFLPTHGENFGHVIFDAINCGLPVLLSNNTPWKNIEKYSIGWSVPLENEEKFIQIINSFQNWELSYKQNFNENSKKFLIENFNLNDVIISYKKLFNI